MSFYATCRSLGLYGGYKSLVNAGVLTEYSSAAFRYGHSEVCGNGDLGERREERREERGRINKEAVKKENLERNLTCFTGEQLLPPLQGQRAAN